MAPGENAKCMMPRRSPAAACLALALALIARFAAATQPGWIAAPDVQRRLTAGEVVVEATTSVDPARPRGGVRAAVLIRAKPEAIWSVMTDCAQATLFVPGLRRCRRVEAGPDGRWEDIEQEIHYAWYLPDVTYVFRADYERPHRIDFHRIRGDLKEEQGSWILNVTPDGSATVVEYEMYLDPGFWVPQFLVNRSLRKDLPEALAGLRQRVELPPRAP